MVLLALSKRDLHPNAENSTTSYEHNRRYMYFCWKANSFLTILLVINCRFSGFHKFCIFC